MERLVASFGGSPEDVKVKQRWRLVLGRYAQSALGVQLEGQGHRIDRTLEYLYGREYSGRGVRPRLPLSGR